MSPRIRLVALCSLSSVAAMLFAACADDDEVPGTPGIDAGGLDGARLDGTIESGPSPDSGGLDTGVLDSGTDSAAVDAADASDANAADAADAADAALGVFLYAHASGTLYRVDPNDAGITAVGPSGTLDMRLMWDEGAGVLRGIATALSAPTLATVDRCTGAATLGSRLTKVNDAGADAGLLARAECWARHPNGTVYGGGDWNGDPPTAPASESLITVDVVDGGARRIAFPFKTTQADCDSATFIGSDFYVLDPAVPTTSGIYRVDLNDAGGVKVGTPSLDIIRIGYDESRSTLFGVGSTRTLYRVDVGDASASAVGVMGAAGLAFDSIVAAPQPVCP